MHHDYQVFLALDVGEDGHDAGALTRDGKRLLVPAGRSYRTPCLPVGGYGGLVEEFDLGRELANGCRSAADVWTFIRRFAAVYGMKCRANG
jgi:hypothetical protein